MLSIGPVQGFILAARRTRDLWIGSHLLSEISKAAAKKISDERGQLIFPSLEMEKLIPSNSPDAPNVANIILAELELPDGKDPSDLNQRVKTAAQDEWMQYAKGAKCLAERLSSGFINQDIWDDQVKDVLEFYSAWVPMPKEEDAYQGARKRLMQLLASRKATRDFTQTIRDDKLPKSSLDGSRDTVLLKTKSEISKELAIRMRLNAGEQLCVVGLTKRLGGKRFDDLKEGEETKLEAFPSVVRVALDPWVRGIIKSGDDAKGILIEINKICKKNENIAQGAGRSQNKERRYPNFPFDGQVLHLPRIAAMMNAIKKSNDPKKKVPDKLMRWEARLSNDDMNDLMTLKGLVERLQKSGKTKNGEKCLGFGEPERYYAILAADGDRMGKVISARRLKGEHIRFSASLSQFADNAREIVKKHNGCMVYSGGDDVLAFLPLDTCLHAARVLHRKFSILLDEFPDENGKTPTLSVGIAIGHSMEPLEDILGFARGAENAAKKGENAKDERDGLAVHIYPRSGVPIKIRDQWKAKGENGLDERLLKWANMHCRDELPDRAAYDMRELAEDYRNWSASTEEEKKALGSIIYADALRLLKRKRAGHGGEAIKEEIVKDFKEMLSGVDSYEKITRLANELIIARRLASAIKQANRKPQNNENAEEET
ncbi:MAG: type III-B CRISPR-associated protein Cas10/Cmr2 [Methanothrix sp.]|nr:type III-B CRISPR-associated protein Cas10/Cmr2 [Methanothrix sp.]